MGIVSGIQLLFVAAKLFGFIAWSWWLVFLPTITITLGWAFLFLVAIVVAAMPSK